MSIVYTDHNDEEWAYIENPDKTWMGPEEYQLALSFDEVLEDIRRRRSR